MMKDIICDKCIHCISIDIEQNVNCNLYIGGKAKWFCRDFKERKEEGGGVKK